MFRQGCANKVFDWEDSAELSIPEQGEGMGGGYLKNGVLDSVGQMLV